jgi:hypothetical protein
LLCQSTGTAYVKRDGKEKHALCGCGNCRCGDEVRQVFME